MLYLILRPIVSTRSCASRRARGVLRREGRGLYAAQAGTFLLKSPKQCVCCRVPRPRLRADAQVCGRRAIAPMQTEYIITAYVPYRFSARRQTGSDAADFLRRRNELGYGLRRLKGMMPLRIPSCCRRIY